MTKVGAIYLIYVYILKCKDNSYYTGVTNDLEYRLQQHKEGLVTTCYTFHRRPLELVYYIGFQNNLAAISFEKKIKKWSKSKKEALIAGKFEELTSLSRKSFFNKEL